MNLAQFHTLLDDFSDEGGLQDGRIPTLVRQAVLHFERNYNFQYMKRTTTLSFPIAAEPVMQSLGKFVKAIMSIEVRDPGTTKGLKRVAITEDSHAVLDDQEFEEKFPVLKMVASTGDTLIAPMVAMTAAKDLHVWYVSTTTDWPVDHFDLYTHPLIDRAEDVLLARCMVQMSSVTKDPELLQFYQGLYQEGLKTLLDSDFAFTIEEA